MVEVIEPQIVIGLNASNRFGENQFGMTDSGNSYWTTSILHLSSISRWRGGRDGAQGFKAGYAFDNVPKYLLQFCLIDNFFEKRGRWRCNKGVFTLRYCVNKMLHYGIDADI